MKVQTALLRVLAEKKVMRMGAHVEKPIDVRIIAATNADVRDERTFRPDLFERLSVCEVKMPTLRDRMDDMLALAAGTWQSTFNERIPRLTAEAAETLHRHDWPGNIRELAGVLYKIRERLKKGEPIYRDLVVRALEPEAAQDRASENQSIAPPWERKDLASKSRDEWQALVTEFDGNATRIAEALSCHRRTVARYLSSFGLAEV